MIQTLPFEACRRQNLAPQFIFFHRGTILLRAGSTKLSRVNFFFSSCLKASCQKQTLARQVFVALTCYFSGIWGSKCRESLRALLFQFPLDSCFTENGNHLVFAAVPCSTELKWQSSWVGDCFCNLSDDKEMTETKALFFLSSQLPVYAEAWKHLAPSFIKVYHSLSISFCLPFS